MLGTQWRTGVNGACGLDYPAMYPLMDRMGLPPNEWALLFSEMRILENAALAAMNHKD